MWDPFDTLTDKYDEWFEKYPGKVLYKNELLAVKKALKNAPKPWCEIGIGTGRFASKLGVKLGIDPSMESLKLAAKRGIKVIQAKAEALPLATSSMGTVLLIVTICFIDNPEEAFKECFRVLKPGGLLIAGLVPAQSSWGKFYTKKKSEGHPFYKVAKFYTPKQVEKLLKESGFEPEGGFSTIFESPTDPHKIQKPVNGIFSEAGFVVIRGRKPL